MNKSISRLILSILSFLLLCPFLSEAQNTISSEAGLNSHRKIFVVMTVCIIILVGLILYLVSIDRKISKLEKENKS